MRRRTAKRQGDCLRGALSRAHGKIHGHEYELDLLRRANTALSHRSSQQLAQARATQEEMGARLAQLRNFARDVERLVGQYSIAAEGPKATAKRAYGNELRLPMMMSPDFRRLGADLPMHEVAAVRDRTLRLLEFRSVRDELRNATHLRAILRDGEVGYFVSDEALDESPLEYIVSRIAEEMADHLMKHLRARRGRGRNDNFADIDTLSRARY